MNVPVRDSAMIIRELGEYLNGTAVMATYKFPEEVESQLDVRSVLRLALDQCSDSDRSVRYNLDDLHN